ncbi:MAG: hypothetical protein ABEI86_04320 [Halobacteriaceae archaeon]
MNRLIAGLCICLLLTGVGPIHATSPIDNIGITRHANTTNSLGLETVAKSGFSNGKFDLVGAINIQFSSVKANMLYFTVEEKLQSANTPAAKRKILSNAINDIQEQVNILLRKEQQARMAFINNSISLTDYTIVLGKIDGKADHIYQILQKLDRLAENIPNTGKVKAKIRFLESKLVSLRGPIRSTLAKIVTGSHDQERISIAVSSKGVVLTTIENGQFIHEAYRRDHFDPGPDNFTLSDAITRVKQLYPWGWKNSTGPSIIGLSGSVYLIRMAHGHGSLQTYLDGTTGHIYREFQYKTLSGIPIQNTITKSKKGLKIYVNTTHPGGPIQIQLTNGNGKLLTGVVRINNTVIGKTVNGRLWTLHPYNPFTIHVTYENTTVSISFPQT